MRIETSTVENIKISEVKGLDLINVYLEDIEPRKGRIIIECYGKSWSSFWGGMGDRNIKQFFCSCDKHYLAKRLAQGIDHKIYDYENLDVWLKEEIIRLRRNNELKAIEARHLWEDVTIYCENDEYFIRTAECGKLAQTVFGDDWWHCLPVKVNQEYEYLCRIIETVKEALNNGF